MNTIDSGFSEAEIVHMLNITKPKAIFCEFNIVEVVKNSLIAVQSSAKIFTFCGSAEGVTPVTDLFDETGYENDFM